MARFSFASKRAVGADALCGGGGVRPPPLGGVRALHRPLLAASSAWLTAPARAGAGRPLETVGGGRPLPATRFGGLELELDGKA